MKKFQLGDTYGKTTADILTNDDVSKINVHVTLRPAWPLIPYESYDPGGQYNGLHRIVWNAVIVPSINPGDHSQKSRRSILGLTPKIWPRSNWYI